MFNCPSCSCQCCAICRLSPICITQLILSSEMVILECWIYYKEFCVNDPWAAILKSGVAKTTITLHITVLTKALCKEWKTITNWETIVKKRESCVLLRASCCYHISSCSKSYPVIFLSNPQNPLCSLMRNRPIICTRKWSTSTAVTFILRGFKGFW